MALGLNTLSIAAEWTLPCKPVTFSQREKPFLLQPCPTCRVFAPFSLDPSRLTPEERRGRRTRGEKVIVKNKSHMRQDRQMNRLTPKPHLPFLLLRR
jgi:hypothetical protein